MDLGSLVNDLLQTHLFRWSDTSLISLLLSALGKLQKLRVNDFSFLVVFPLSNV